MRRFFVFVLVSRGEIFSVLSTIKKVEGRKFPRERMNPYPFLCLPLEGFSSILRRAPNSLFENSFLEEQMKKWRRGGGRGFWGVQSTKNPLGKRRKKKLPFLVLYLEKKSFLYSRFFFFKEQMNRAIIVFFSGFVKYLFLFFILFFKKRQKNLKFLLLSWNFSKIVCIFGNSNRFTKRVKNIQ